MHVPAVMQAETVDVRDLSSQLILSLSLYPSHTEIPGMYSTHRVTLTTYIFGARVTVNQKK